MDSGLMNFKLSSHHFRNMGLNLQEEQEGVRKEELSILEAESQIKTQDGGKHQ